MKKTTFLILLCIVFWTTSTSCFAQVDDLPETFTKRGYIQNINYELKQVLVNYIIENNVESEVIQLQETSFLNHKNATLSINDFKSNDEISIIGDKFKERKLCIAKQITLIEKKINTKRNGRIDYIKDDLAIVDGFKVKLKSGKAIKGVKKSGYDKQSYTAVNQLKLGIFANVEGDFEGKDYINTDNFTIEPDTDNEYDKIATKIDKDNYEKFYPLWIDKKSRVSLFNTTIDGVGKILNDADVQEYIGTVAEKIIPDFLKKRTNFIFIVVENSEPSANIRANGLAYVNTGLLKILENEAQLATILGHEISHVLYKHNADELNNKDKANKDKDNVKKKGNIFSNAWKSAKEETSDVIKNDIGLSDKKTKIIDGVVSLNQSETATTLKKSYIDKRVSKYSVNQELQADRVGLALMVLAGYDPREAPIVWKNQIINFENNPQKEEGVSIDKAITKELTKDPKKKTKNTIKKVETTKKTDEVTEEEIVTEDDKSTLDKVGTLFVTWKTDDNVAKSLGTHPDEIKRFEELNRLISVMWDSEELFKNAQNGEKKYLKIKKRLKAPKSNSKKS